MRARVASSSGEIRKAGGAVAPSVIAASRLATGSHHHRLGHAERI
jgi:hypothetical protein